jgi:hypothetical protein
MKLLKNLLLISLLALVACKMEELEPQTVEEPDPQTWVNAEVTGFDSRRCSCCGGYIVEIKGKRYLTKQLPEAFQNLLNIIYYGYPLKVRLKYEAAKGSCPTDFNLIKVLEIEFRA